MGAGWSSGRKVGSWGQERRKRGQVAIWAWRPGGCGDKAPEGRKGASGGWLGWVAEPAEQRITQSDFSFGARERGAVAGLRPCSHQRGEGPIFVVYLLGMQRLRPTVFWLLRLLKAQPVVDAQAAARQESPVCGYKRCFQHKSRSYISQQERRFVARNQECGTGSHAMRYEPVQRQRIFEARYERGYRYFDRCGEVMGVLLEQLSEETKQLWLLDEATVQGTRLQCPELNLRLVFNANRIVLDEFFRLDVAFDFALLATMAFGIVRGRFDVKEVKRFGFRVISVCPTNSVEEAQRLSYNIWRPDSWHVPDNDGMSPLFMEQTAVYATDVERKREMRVVTEPFNKPGADLTVDPRLKQPPHLLPKDQREALLAQLARDKQNRQDPETGLAIDLDYSWTWPHDHLTVHDFLHQADEQTKFFTSHLMERLQKCATR